MNTADPQDSDLPSSEDISCLLPGYEILRLIAQGGMGAVYLARQKSLDREVAIKILPREFSQDEEFRASFETEAKCMARLNHRNLIGVYDFGEKDGLLYIIMELVPGQSLYHLIQQGCIFPVDALQLTASVCHGLASAHAHGILHRDIKPANILLDEKGSPKIVDFGLARPVGAHEQDSCFGTPGYTAPEVLRNPKGVSERTDIFSVGVILYEMLTGELPTEPYVPAAQRVDCHAGFDRIITRAIHQAPLLRYGSANEMAEALAKLADEMAAPSVRLVTQPGIHKTGPLGQAQITHGRHHGSAPAVVEADSGHWVRRLLMIGGLVLALAFAWQGLKRTQDGKAREQATIEARERAQQEQEEAAEREALDRQKQAATEKAEQERREAEAQALAAKAKAEPPLIALERLRSSLVSGVRNELPPGTVTAADRARLLVPEPMSWHQARRFCEEHGGYLAVLPDAGDLTRLVTTLKSGEDAWIGGGSNGLGGWCWVDGTAWQHEFRPPPGPAYLTLRDLGILKAAPAAEKRGFFIEWAMDGANPGSLREELQRCATSQSSPAKLYPAGSSEYNGGRYLLLEADTTWEQASKLAESAGGKLAIPSTREENDWLFQLHESALGKENPCWLGGLRNDAGAWHWINGEPWSFATWMQGTPDEPSGKSCGCAIVSGSWDDFPVETTHPALLIEWSAATTGGSAPVANSPPKGDGLVKKRATCKELVTAIQRRHDKLFASNISAYFQAIDVQLRKLPTQARELAAPSKLVMTNSITGGRIPSNIPSSSLSPELAIVLETHLARQTQQDTAYQADLFSMAAKYRRSLQDEADRLKQQGQSTLQQEVEAEIQAANGDPKAFFTHITGTPYPDGLAPALATIADIPGGAKNWKITSSGNQPGGEPQKAIDGDAQTNWHTPWDTSTKENRHPHTLDIDFGQVIAVAALKLTARATGYNGRIKDFVIWTRAEGGDWKQVKKSDLPDNAEPQTVHLPGRVSTRYLRIESLNSHHGDCTSLAEVDVLHRGS